MPKAQRYFNVHFPDKGKYEEINLNNRNLEGELVIDGYDNLKTLDLSNNQLTKLTIRASKRIYFYPKYPLVDCSYNQLIDLSFQGGKFVSLVLNCSFNQLEILDISAVETLKGLDCRNNYLIDIPLSHLGGWWSFHRDGGNFPSYFFADNNCLEQFSLKDLARFSALRRIRLGNTDPDRVVKGEYNHIRGNISELGSKSNLNELNIDNTDVIYEDGKDKNWLRNRAENLAFFPISNNLRPEAKCSTVIQELEPYDFYLIAWMDKQLVPHREVKLQDNIQNPQLQLEQEKSKSEFLMAQMETNPK